MILADYYKEFKCKCGDCRRVCCGGWGITVSDAEYFRLLGLQCSEELRRRLDVALAPADDPSPERFAIMKPSYTGKCRLINEEGLCSLQIECGEEVLPAVCRMYPRSVTAERAGCSCSCERVVEMLMREEPLSFSEPLPEPLSRYVKAMRDRSAPVSERVIRLVDAALPSGLYYNGPVLLSMYAKTLAEHSEFMRETVVPVTDAYAADAEKLASDSAEFDRRFPHADEWFENILVNRMFLTGFPSDDPVASVCGLACEYALLRVMTLKASSDEDFVDRVSELYRYIGHTNFDKNSTAAINICGALSKDGVGRIVRVQNSEL